jgi:hypothetical protein
MAKSKESKEFKLPKYLRLEKGSMWFDDQGDNCSGVRLFASTKVLTGRPFKMIEVTDMTGEKVNVPVATEIEKDDHGNSDYVSFGKKETDLKWYVDTTKIPKENLSRVLLAYKFGILVEADPKNPPGKKKEVTGVADEFGYKDNGDRVFIGKNKEMYTKLQNLNFINLRKFVNDAPLTKAARRNLIDLLDYEQKGYNPLNRARQEVLELIRKKLNEFGPGMTGIRVNEEE